MLEPLSLENFDPVYAREVSRRDIAYRPFSSTGVRSLQFYAVSLTFALLYNRSDECKMISIFHDCMDECDLTQQDIFVLIMYHIYVPVFYCLH